MAQLRAYADEANVKLTAKRQRLLQGSLAERDSTAEPVVRSISKPGKAEPDPFHGLFATTIDGKTQVVEYEPDSELRDTEQIPLQEPGGIEAFIRREVLRTRPTPGSTRARPRSATRSASTAISTSRSHCGRWRPSGRISWPWRRRPRDCWRGSWGPAPDSSCSRPACISRGSVALFKAGFIMSRTPAAYARLDY
jgi:hypothetical protein